MGKRSRDKGARGEREWAALLRTYGYDSQRGCQHKGGPDSPDVITDCPLHFEVKRTEKLSIYKALEQAELDAYECPPAVAHRRNGRKWVVIMDAEDLLEIFSRLGYGEDTLKGWPKDLL